MKGALPLQQYSPRFLFAVSLSSVLSILVASAGLTSLDFKLTLGPFSFYNTLPTLLLSRNTSAHLAALATGTVFP